MRRHMCNPIRQFLTSQLFRRPFLSLPSLPVVALRQRWSRKKRFSELETIEYPGWDFHYYATTREGNLAHIRKFSLRSQLQLMAHIYTTIRDLLRVFIFRCVCNNLEMQRYLEPIMRGIRSLPKCIPFVGAQGRAGHTNIRKFTGNRSII